MAENHQRIWVNQCSAKAAIVETFSLKNPNVAYKFAWGQIPNKYAVISPDKQNNDRKMTRLLSLNQYFGFAYDFKTMYSSKMTIEYS